MEKCSGGGKEGGRWARSSALYLPLTQINPVTAREPHCLWRSFQSFNPRCLPHVEVWTPLSSFLGVSHSSRSPRTTRGGLLWCIFIWNFCIFTAMRVLVSSVLVLIFFFFGAGSLEILWQSTFRIIASGSEQVAEVWNESVFLFVFFFLEHGFLKPRLQRSSLRSVCSPNLTVVCVAVFPRS